jgi:hypothetical protein
MRVIYDEHGVPSPVDGPEADSIWRRYCRWLAIDIETQELAQREPYIAVPDQEDTEAQWRTVNLQAHEKLARLAKIVWSDDPDWRLEPDLLAITRDIARSNGN